MLMDYSSTASAETNKKPDNLLLWQHFDQANNLRISGHYQEAIEYYKKALKIDSSHQNSLYYLGNLQLLMKDFKAASQTWNRLITANPMSARGYAQLGTLHSFNDPSNYLYDLDRSVVFFRKASLLNQEETGPLLELAKIDLLYHRWDSAEVKLNNVISTNFRSVEAMFLQGYLAWKNGDHHKAESLLNKVVLIKQNSHPKFANVGEGETRKEPSSGESDTTQYRLFSYVIQHLTDKILENTDFDTNSIYLQFEMEKEK